MFSPAFKGTVLFVNDVPASRRFYEDLLGLRAELDLGDYVVYAGGLAIWQIGSACMNVHGRPHDPTGQTPLGRDNLELYFEAEDLEAAAARCEQAGVRCVHALKEQAWAQRAIRVYDPDGHIVEIGEPMQTVVRRLAAAGADRAAIAQRTAMPPAFIEQALAGKA